MPPRPLDRSKCRCWTLAWTLAGMLGGLSFANAGGVGSSADSPRTGLDPMAASNSNTALLVDYYEHLLRDGDVEGFQRNVSARYTDATLGRLIDSTDLRARRASVLSLGLFGGFAGSNAALGRALKDKDPMVRDLAHDALWAVWYRADTPEHNESLTQIRKQISQGKLAEAIEAADRLITAAPTFAEAYNQRAIAHFILGHHAASATDCRRVLELNPCHFGALGGLAQCLMRLDKRDETIVVLRQSLELQPFDDGLRDLIASLEAGR